MHLKKNLTTNNQIREIIPVALKGSFAIEQKLFENQISEFVEVEYALSNLLFQQTLKPMAEYPSYVPGYTIQNQLVPNPEYLKFVDYLRSNF